MALRGDTSSAATREFEKPVVVRVKRKPWQHRLEALWLEINERPLKRSALDFNKLSIGDDYYTNHGQEGWKTKKVLVQHVETTDTSEATVAIVQSFMYNSADAVKDKPQILERNRTFKKDAKLEELKSKSRKDQQVLAQNARFEQIWRSRLGSEHTVDAKLHGMCHFYDVVHIHDDEGFNVITTSLEDQRILSGHLPIPKECIPSAVAEIESDIYAYLSEQGYEFVPRSVADIESDIHAYLYKQDDHVYDYYTVKDDMDIGEGDAISTFPVVQVEDDDDFYDGQDQESEYDSDDSNAEAHLRNDYPDESSEESAISTEEEEEESGNGSSVSSEDEDLMHGLASDGVLSEDDGLKDNGDDNSGYMKNINEDLRDLDIKKD